MNNARHLPAPGRWLLLLLFVPLPGLAEEPGSTPSWLTFASVFRPEKQDVMKRALAGTQAKFYVDYLKDPQNPEHLRRVADLYFHLGEYSRAARWYFRLLQLDPGDREAPAWFAESLYHAQATDQSLHVLEALAAHDQDTSITRTLRAEIYYATKKHQAARELLEQILEHTKDKPASQEMTLLREMLTHNLRVVHTAMEDKGGKRGEPNDEATN